MKEKDGRDGGKWLLIDEHPSEVIVTIVKLSEAQWKARVQINNAQIKSDRTLVCKSIGKAYTWARGLIDDAGESGW